MAKTFNVTGACIPEEHYMVDIHARLKEIKELVDAGKYFTIHRARQYGKTTTLLALERFLQKEYYVVSMDFQTFGNAEFSNENTFALSFSSSFVRILKRAVPIMPNPLKDMIGELRKQAEGRDPFLSLKTLFEYLGDICGASDKPIVLMIDEVDTASNNQVFLDFLAQLRALYIRRAAQPSFRSVILSGVYDVKNLKRKLCPEDGLKVNSPWNIAADFNVDMSLSQQGIAGMLCEYEEDFNTGMDIGRMAGMLQEYTAGYPFLVSRLCQMLDEVVSCRGEYGTKDAAWTERGFLEALRMLLSERNTLFESLSEKLISYPELEAMLKALLFTGKNITYNFYEPAISIATMFGFVADRNGMLVIANRIFDTWLYNYFLSNAEVRGLDIYKLSMQDRNQFVTNGRLNMRRVLEKFVLHFSELYGDRGDSFLEEEGRKYFLLYLRPIINGTGNYYVESRTRDLRRTDVIVDYRGEQYVIEMKLWHGEEYNRRGEEQLVGYLNDYNQNKGYMVSFNFNKSKQVGVREIAVGDKMLIEAMV
ncbi:AAA-like domain-containing protein [uncultured Acetatifactor sp.]|uniref:AAA-like domain-containing protein n=1 Tax=uncultured Acetatifactor sp. TaxID=1671927 RepID=UPI002633025F|nr:AAA-like domain-containing protein [uncultured Acetatifactor sp.]